MNTSFDTLLKNDGKERNSLFQVQKKHTFVFGNNNLGEIPVVMALVFQRETTRCLPLPSDSLDLVIPNKRNWLKAQHNHNINS